MTIEEFRAAREARHLQNALRRIKNQSDRLASFIQKNQTKFPESRELADISTKVSDLSTTISSKVEVVSAKTPVRLTK